MSTIGEFENSLDDSCNFSVSLKLFQSQNFTTKETDKLFSKAIGCTIPHFHQFMKVLVTVHSAS